MERNVDLSREYKKKSGLSQNLEMAIKEWKRGYNKGENRGVDRRPLAVSDRFT